MVTAHTKQDKVKLALMLSHSLLVGDKCLCYKENAWIELIITALEGYHLLDAIRYMY